MLDLKTLKFIQSLLNGADAIKNDIVEEFVDAKRALRAYIEEEEAKVAQVEASQPSEQAPGEPAAPVEGEVVNPAPDAPASDAQPQA